MGDGIAERQWIEQLMESQWYDIEVLEKFAGLQELSVLEAAPVQLNSARKDSIPNYPILKLTPDQYDKEDGILRLTPFHNIEISKRGTAKRNSAVNGQRKYFECWVMERVFKSVNTMREGAKFSRILGVSDKNIGKTEIKKIQNAVTTINKKVVDDEGPKQLLIIQRDKVKINNSYL